MKTSLLKMKKAVVKCTGMDMPELDLPMYNNPHRFVHALLEGAEDLKTMKMFKAMSALSGQQYNQQSQNAPIQLVLGQQQAPQDNMMKKMFMKMMMKKMFHDKESNESPFGNMGSMKYGQENQDNQDQYKFFQNMMQAMNRNKRATDDLFELGDRLTDKLSKKLKNGKLSSETHPAYLRNSTSLTKTKTSISAEWSNLLNVENGESSQTNGLRNNTSRTAAPALPSPIPSQKLFSKNALGEKSGEES